MPELINEDKGLDSPAFNTYIPELEEPADIRDALKLLYYGTLENGPTYEVTDSLYGNLINFNTRIDQNNALFTGHDGAIFNIHGTGAGSRVVGTLDAMTLENKTLTSPVINGGTVNGGAALTVDSTELNYVDGVTSSIQTQINTNTPVGMISIHAGTTAPTGWLLCDGGSYSTTTYANLHSVVGYQFGGSGASFNVPNLKGRVVVGIDGAQASFDGRGETGGAMNHQHASSNSGVTGTGHNHTVSATNGTAAEAGAHNHSVNSNHSHGIGHDHDDTFSISVSGGSHNHGLAGSVTANTTAVGRASSGNTSTNFQLGGFQANDNFAVSNSSSHSHSTTKSGGVTAISSTNSNSSGSNAANFNTVSGSGAHAHNVSNNAATINDGAGGNHAHSVAASDSLSNLQPYMALNYIIKI
jgi:microcystin-dependent protein